ncbi:hypothetical protein [Vibrio phage PJN101]|nr:hypothetical protein [Vibrio phage PJN101]
MNPLLAIFGVLLIILGIILGLIALCASASKPRYRVIEVDKPSAEVYPESVYAVKEFKLWGAAPTGEYASKRGSVSKAESFQNLKHSGCLFTTASQIEDVLNLVQPPKITGTSRSLKEIKMEGLIDGNVK